MRSLFVATVVTFAASAAWPCSPAVELGIAPIEGALGVPTNASLFFAIGDAPGTAVLVDESTDARTDLVIEFASLSRATLPALSPSTSYRVEMDIIEGTPSRTLTFTTGEGPDALAPDIEDVESDVAVEKVPGELTFGEGCSMVLLPVWRDERVFTRVTLGVDVAPDTVLVRLFRTLDGERLERTAKFTDASLTPIEGAVRVAIEDNSSDVGEALYEIVAVDAAGNESTHELEVTLGQLADDGGCAQTSPASAASLVAVLVLLQIRRRRAPRVN